MIVFGIIGCGSIGQRHAKHIVAHPGAALAGVYDIKAERTAALAGQYEGAKVYDTFEAMVQDPDVDIISICTPNGLHPEHAIQAMQGGKHVLVEKPMAIFKADGEEMIQTSLRTGRNLFVVKQNRFNPPVQAVKHLMDQHKLGKIYTVAVNCYWNRGEMYYQQSDWKGTKALDGGTLYTQYSHFVDIIYYLFGDLDILHASFANVSHHDTIEFEDTGVVSYRLIKHNAIGTLHYTTAAYQKNMEGSFTIFAEHATIKIGGKYLNTIDYQLTDGFDIRDLPESNQSNNYGFYEGSMSNHDKVINNVVLSLQGKEQIMTNAYDGLKVVEIIENMYKTGHFIG